MNTRTITRIVAVSLALLPWLLPETAQCFYNASTGRWLNRDPAGEDAFLAQHSRGRPLRERQELRSQRLKPLYLFSGNQPLSGIDAVGLRLVCVFNIRATHFLSGAMGAYDHFHSTDWSALPPGDAFGYISCGANTLNGMLASLNRCASIPGMPRNNNDQAPEGALKRDMDEHGIPYDDRADSDEIPIFLDSALEAAKSLATARCRSRECGCCMNIRIVFTCDRDARTYDQPPSYEEPLSKEHGERLSGVTKCGKSTALDCKSGNFTILR
jgi:hypothetical protein